MIGFIIPSIADPFFQLRRAEPSSANQDGIPST
jgi:hypothetical protein